MSELLEKIKKAVHSEDYLIGAHAGERMDERGIPDWQVVEGMTHARLVEERPSDLPNPVVEVIQMLPDGTEVKVVWAWLEDSGAAKLVTVHYLDDEA